tara:strand:+ start:60 stop:272 length:213 start_codon:yes stop_codon:yes gene_type:complete
MVVEEVVSNLVGEVGRIALWLQAIGLIVVIWIGVQIINLILNRKKRKAIYRVEERLVRLERKIDKVLKKK